MTILFVCTGNTCRSPMAEALMRAQLRRRNVLAVVASAGLAAGGDPAATNAIEALAEEGLELSRHRSRPLTRELSDAADVIAVMTDEHRRLLLAAGVAPDKVRVLGGGIPDPFGGDLAVYRRTRDVLKRAVSDLADDLFFKKGGAMTIVPMAPEHLAAVAALEQACFSRPWSEAALEQELANPAAVFWVALDETGAVAGYAGMHRVLDEGAITNVAVRADRRRQGIAAALLRHQAKRAAESGVCRLTLEVRVSNTAAIALYEQLGYERDGVRPRFYDRPIEDAALYSLHLKKRGQEV